MNKKGFTLVELLAVIVILAILIIFAMPNVLNMFKQAKKSSFVNEARVIYNEVPKKFLQDQLSGNNTSFYSSVESSKLDVNSNLDYCVMVDSKGKVKKIAVGNNEYHVSVNNGKDIDNINEEVLETGSLELESCSSEVFVPHVPDVACTYNGSLVAGATFTQGQYTYKYNQVFDVNEWDYVTANIDGWSVRLTDYESTAPATSEICSVIKNKPVKSAAGMYAEAQASSIDVSSFNSSNVTDMSYMFANSAASTIIGLNNLNTSAVTNMSGMFNSANASSLDLSKFNTSNVTNMYLMFFYSNAANLDLSSFDMSGVNDTGWMFYDAVATTGYARTQADANKFNASDGKPAGLTFTVK